MKKEKRERERARGEGMNGRRETNGDEYNKCLCFQGVAPFDGRTRPCTVSSQSMVWLFNTSSMF